MGTKAEANDGDAEGPQMLVRWPEEVLYVLVAQDLLGKLLAKQTTKCSFAFAETDPRENQGLGQASRGTLFPLIP